MEFLAGIIFAVIVIAGGVYIHNKNEEAKGRGVGAPPRKDEEENR